MSENQDNTLSQEVSKDTSSDASQENTSPSEVTPTELTVPETTSSELTPSEETTWGKGHNTTIAGGNGADALGPEGQRGGDGGDVVFKPGNDGVGGDGGSVVFQDKQGRQLTTDQLLDFYYKYNSTTTTTTTSTSS